MKRGFLAKKLEKLEVDDSKADGGWRKTDMPLLGKLSTALYLKKIVELAELDRGKEGMRDQEHTGLISDADAEASEQAIQFRRNWITRWSGSYGKFDDITIIDPMRFTYDPPPPSARLCDTVQVFSVKVADIIGDLQWPLDVFGMVCLRDSVDRNRNLIFYRTRDNCQVLTEKDQCLVLSGPSRAVVVSNPTLDPVIFEVKLKVKGSDEFKDKDLMVLAVPLKYVKEPVSSRPHLLYSLYASKRGKLLFTWGHILLSVEATIFIRVIDGSWPDGFQGQFAASTSSIDHEKVILLDFSANNLPISGGGIIKLSRHVVSVEVTGMLKVSLKAWQDDSKEVGGQDVVVFKPAKSGRSVGTLNFGSCKMEVLVAWSLISPEPEPDG